jgi:hypothetical protein
MEAVPEGMGPAVVAVRMGSGRIDRSKACDAAIESTWNTAVADRLLPVGFQRMATISSQRENVEQRASLQQ